MGAERDFKRDLEICEELRRGDWLHFLKAKAENERYRAALEWYASPPDNDWMELYRKSDFEDLTRRAREALGITSAS